ncbi:MAG: GTPase HflX [Candidatus Dependentiae bacterium]
MAVKKEYITQQFPKTLLLGIQAPYNRNIDINSYFEEFLNLVKSNRTHYDEVKFITLREIDPGYFLTQGKLEQVKEICDKLEIEEVIISEPLTVQQERNLSELLHCKIYDRTRLILEIFEKSATSAEGKLQVAIAMLQFDKSRLSGQGIFLSQQAGKIGNKGPGETIKERETRHIENAILKIKKQLEKLHTARQTQRKRRLASNIPLICLIGYTNAGKSTILNSLTKSSVLAEDKLFATLETTTRELYIDGKKTALISDTVGFIQQLPHQLIEAFKSTLSELEYADLLLHVIDIADANWELHIKTVHQILKELDVNKPMIYVFNKADKIDNKEQIESKISKYQPHVLVSAHNKTDLQPLIDYIFNFTENFKK